MPHDVDQVTNNQGQINYLLVDVDHRVIWTLRELLEELKKAPTLKGLDFSRMEKALIEAEGSRRRVADITPPGCVVPPPPPVPPPLDDTGY